jgi:hypothetical protein
VSDRQKDDRSIELNPQVIFSNKNKIIQLNIIRNPDVNPKKQEAK